jgi:putative membrane protein
MKILKLILAGIVIGVANVIPGVSGGTMAVVFGIYDELIGIISLLVEKKLLIKQS